MQPSRRGKQGWSAALLSQGCCRGLGFSSEGARGLAEQPEGGVGRSLGPQAEPLVQHGGGGTLWLGKPEAPAGNHSEPGWA